jgi:divalent metal cation (Fe/Co/Zn/Cd) transporter
MTLVPSSSMTERLLKQATLLALITIGYNVLEGLVSIWLGLADETITLFGFGADSFVEVISGIGIWHMLRRQGASSCQATRESFEQRALRITGTAFYLLTTGLIATAALNLWQGHAPKTTFWGIVVSLVSIVSMWLLIRAKVGVGTALQSDAILADAACTRTCLRLSVVLLVASLGYELTGIGLFDSLGSMLIAWLSWREGREAFGKAAGKSCCCGG